MDFVNGQVAPFKKIRQLEVVTEIPKSPAGKILRRTLIERERNKTPSPLAGQG
jgi:acyl-coenzyme A synthetase/AMP-(fatty) acid ligase